MHAFVTSAKRSRQALSRDIAKSGWISAYSPAEFGLWLNLRRTVGAYATGSVLDAGAGSMPYRSLILQTADTYHSLDIDDLEGAVIVGDVMSMSEVPSERYDVVLSSEVLEHVPRPQRAIHEMARVLKPGGYLILSTPHLSRIHEAPNDFYRFTPFALSDLVISAGLNVKELTPVGSVFSLIGHQISSVVVVPLWGVPILKWVVFSIGALLITFPAHLIDKLPALRELLPLNLVMIAQKLNAH